MHLRKPNEAPPGGYYFLCDDGQRIDASSLRKLDIEVRRYLQGNNMQISDDLLQMIEDQICERIPKSFCWKGFGDVVAGAISMAAGAVDAVVGTDFQAQAKSCKTCGQRRRKLNRL
jgi:hypothetical protein